MNGRRVRREENVLDGSGDYDEDGDSNFDQQNYDEDEDNVSTVKGPSESSPIFGVIHHTQSPFA